MNKSEAMRNLDKRLKAATVVSLAIAASAAGLATEVQAKPIRSRSAAAANAGRSAIGNDVSYNQNKASDPKDPAFLIVGTNGKYPNTFNPHFSQQWKLGESSSTHTTPQPVVATYSTIANPGSVKPMVADWPKSGNTPFGECHHTNSIACGYQYGVNKAEADLKSIAPVLPTKMWIDVEPNYSWTNSHAKNAATVEGMVDVFEHEGSNVGLYFQATELPKIIGSITNKSSVRFLPEWLLGATTLSGAEANCKIPSVTGSSVEVAQIAPTRPDQIDRDIACSS